MSGPRLEACYFGADPVWVRMARVLEATAAEQCPDWRRSVAQIQPKRRRSVIGLAAHEQNAQKIEHWAAAVADAGDGECLLLMDVDTAIVRPLDDVWTREFDLAYTVKRGPFPFNLGVIFVRASDRTRAFFARWRDENLAMLTEEEAREWRKKWGGINQASFGRLMAAGALTDLQLLQLDCAEWNCEDSTWHRFNPATTRILHIKAALRRAVFQRNPVTPDFADAFTFYRDLEFNGGRLQRSA